MFTWLKRAELCAIVDKDNRLILHMDDHIGSAISVYIAKLAGYGDQVAAAANERRPGIDESVSCIPTGELNNNDTAVQIHKDKVRGPARAILVSHHGVYLVGARHAIGHVVLVQLPPGTKGVKTGK